MRRYPDKVLDKNKSPREIQEVKNLIAKKEFSGIERVIFAYQKIISRKFQP